MIGMVGHGRASPPADLKARACHACINIEVTELSKNHRVVPHILESHVTDVSNDSKMLDKNIAKIALSPFAGTCRRLSPGPHAYP